MGSKVTAHTLPNSTPLIKLEHEFPTSCTGSLKVYLYIWNVEYTCNFTIIKPYPKRFPTDVEVTYSIVIGDEQKQSSGKTRNVWET